MSKKQFPASSEAGRTADDTSRDYAHSQSVQSLEQSLQRLSDLSQSSTPYISPYAPIPSRREPSRQSIPSSSRASSSARSSSALSRINTDFKISGTDQYSPTTTSAMSSGKAISAADKARLIKSLESHSVNTVIELRRIERVLTYPLAQDVTGPLTNAWAHYVNSNNLLSELRGLTRSYPFSSECLDEAKWMVISDPQSTKSWNYCWLVLTKVNNQNLIPKHARQLAAKPTMWGGRTPTAQNVEQLATTLTNEWTRALTQMLRHWEAPPLLPGRK